MKINLKYSTTNRECSPNVSICFLFGYIWNKIIMFKHYFVYKHNIPIMLHTFLNNLKINCIEQLSLVVIFDNNVYCAQTVLFSDEDIFAKIIKLQCCNYRFICISILSPHLFPNLIFFLSFRVMYCHLTKES